MKKIRISSEIVYIMAILLLSISLNVVAIANKGMSMIVAPAYLLSLKLPISYGQCEYIIQAFMLILMWCICRKINFLHVLGFITGVLYGTFCDMWAYLFVVFQSPISNTYIAWCAFVIGNLMTSLSIALFFSTYIYPQVYELFVLNISQHKQIDIKKFKTCFDLFFLSISVILSLVLFGQIKVIGIGTVISAICNGTVIGFFTKAINKYFDIQPSIKQLYSLLNKK